MGIFAKAIFLGLVAVLASGLGCVLYVDPEISEHSRARIAEIPVPDVTLVRRVVPWTGEKKVIIYTERKTDEVSESAFGDLGEDAVPQCIINGILKDIPDATIVPTMRFWKEIAAPLEKIALSKLFESPMAMRLRALNINALILAYHVEVDVETVATELVIWGGYSNVDEVTAGAIVVDFDKRRLIDSVSVSVQDSFVIMHTLFVIPMFGGYVPKADPCEVVARHAATAIVSDLETDSPTILVLVTENNPHIATTGLTVAPIDLYMDQQEARGAERIEKLRARADKGDPIAEFGIYSALENRLTQPAEAWNWLCKAANQGYAKAQFEMAYWQSSSLWEFWAIREVPRTKWLREAGIGPDNESAYMWYTLAAANGHPDAGYHRQYVANGMTKDQITRADQMARDWKPGDCPSAEHRLGMPRAWS